MDYIEITISYLGQSTPDWLEAQMRGLKAMAEAMGGMEVVSEMPDGIDREEMVCHTLRVRRVPRAIDPATTTLPVLGPEGG